MNTKVQKWGNSLGIRIPFTITKSLNIKANTSIQIKIEGDKIVMQPIKNIEYDLKELISQINESNRHDEQEWGNPIGNEIW
jgi:antitoxin MazE